MAHPGIDPAALLELVLSMLHWAAYILAGFVLVGFSAYVVFLCSELLSLLPRAKAKLAKVPQSVEGAPALEQGYLSPAATPTLVEAVSVISEEVLQEEAGLFPRQEFEL